MSTKLYFNEAYQMVDQLENPSDVMSRIEFIENNEPSSGVL